jgi:hypothetical protein
VGPELGQPQGAAVNSNGRRGSQPCACCEEQAAPCACVCESPTCTRVLQRRGVTCGAAWHAGANE